MHLKNGKRAALTLPERILRDSDAAMMRYITADSGTRTALLREARQAQAEYRSRHGFKKAPAAILTPQSAQAKLAKNSVPSAGLSLLPALQFGKHGKHPINTCPHATGCAAVCLVDTGNGRFNATRRGRWARLGFMLEHPAHAGVILAHELLALLAANGAALVRLNVISDIRWEFVIPNAMAEFVAMGIKFYDYTKFPPELRNPPEGYYLTYSAHENMSLARIIELVGSGENVAIVMRESKRTVQSRAAAGVTWHGLPVVDGIATDDRTSDPRGVVVALAALGKATKDRSGFVREWYSA